MIGETLGTRYRLERELGRGGMATVYLATDLRLSREVAVKVMHPGLGEVHRARLEREARIAASLRHPNVVEVHDVGASGAAFLVMELVQGETLRQLARRAAPVGPEATVLLCLEVARGLAAAHQRGIVHRDVKPENVLIARGGPLKLTDFGIAAGLEHERLTTTGSVSGSLAYIAPERLDSGAFSPASDVYSVGVMLFELCAGRTPFEGRGAAHLAAATLTREPPRLDEVAPEVPEALAALVAACLAKAPEHRPADGAALVEALTRIAAAIAGEPRRELSLLLDDPPGYCARRGEARFAALLARGEGLLRSGDAAQAAKVLNAALTLRPGASEVAALLARRPRRRRALRGLALAAALSGAAAIALVAARSGAPSAAPSPAAVLAAGPEMPAEPVEASPAPSPEAPAPIEAGGSAHPAPSELSEARTGHPAGTGPRSGARLAPARRRVDALTSTAPEPPASSVPAVGRLQVTTRPWAEVILDGTSRGFTPRLKELELPAGKHRLQLANPLCEPYEEEVEIPSGGVLQREVVLQVRKATLSVRAPEGAAVFLDGLQVGVAPLEAPLSVEHGRHSLVARLPGGEVVTREVQAVAGQHAELALEVSR